MVSCVQSSYRTLQELGLSLQEDAGVQSSYRTLQCLTPSLWEGVLCPEQLQNTTVPEPVTEGRRPVSKAATEH
jgi:hypothetical protein